MIKIIPLLTLLLPLACTRYPAGVEETLSLAGSNRGELEKSLTPLSRSSCRLPEIQSRLFLDRQHEMASFHGTSYIPGFFHL